MKIIGITGGVGAGKSTVLDHLEKQYNACVLQADKIGHLVMEPGGICYGQVIALFGKQIIKNDKTIDRKMVSDVVFAHEEMRQKLDDIIHPAVKSYILDKIEEQKKAGYTLMIVEAALLLEDHYDAFCDKVWYIHTDQEIRIERLMSSRGYTREKAENIIARQATEGFFREHADYIIQNNGDLDETWRQIEEGIRAL
ncbi:dephospho-CoA kinase [Blautia sp. OM07-19]|uniref:dephospho-CoA kinase n=1 Tax=Blautia sp. OM07-19 TaxID=2292985 RepID=UPI000E50F793|nr:dephospho-CoA kinase [Blautia sp. OM07-19]RHU99194.1 dephospho-CoA kinase [Blautia sp. OM07-19]